MRYEERMTSFSHEGWMWVEEVRRCLIEEMNRFEQNLGCSELKRRAFQTHVPCYIQSGFCSLSLKDKRAVIKTIWPSISSTETLSAGNAVLKECY
ncbi:MAG: hypothetical protein ACLGHN_04255 [Bacteriovoracia bacterium]